MKKFLKVKRGITIHGRTARLVAIALFAVLLSAAPFHAALAATAPDLGMASSFAVLGGTNVTCTGPGTIIGDIGVSPGVDPSFTNTGCTITGATPPATDAAAVGARIDFLSAYAALAPRTGDCDLAHTLLSTITGPVTLLPGVYCTDAALTGTGVLLLDGGGDSNAVWIFKIGTLGTGALTGTNFSVVTTNGGQPCNVYWWVSQGVTMTTSAFQGTILAGGAVDGSITFTDATLAGQALANVAVTMTRPNVIGCGSLVPPIPPVPPAVCKDFVTGGGWITLPNGGKGTFGVTGGIKQGGLWGHLTYVDHGAKGSKGKDMKVKGTGVTDYTVVDATTRHIEGTAEINGKAGYTYQVDVRDSGEPGRDDMFSLRLSNGYSASGYLDGGNIQLHKKCRPLICAPYDKDDDEGHDGHEDNNGRR